MSEQWSITKDGGIGPQVGGGMAGDPRNDGCDCNAGNDGALSRKTKDLMQSVDDAAQDALNMMIRTSSGI